MNLPNTDAPRIPYERLERFVLDVGTRSGLDSERAGLLARLLATNDARGVTSHGSIQMCTYSKLLRSGSLNPAPKIEVVRESAVSLLVDGDGGLGYFPAFEGTGLLAEKAESAGVAVLLTRNHGHFGAAGIYARIPLGRNLLTFVTSGHQLRLEPGGPIFSAAGGSPMAFGVPVPGDAPLVIDFGCMHDLYASSPFRDAVAKLTPGLVLRHVGLGEICQIWGGLLAGLGLDPENPPWEWPGANQGALVIAFRIDLFADPEEFLGKVDTYVHQIAELTPLEGFDRSFHAGGVEAANEREARERGVPVPPSHLERFAELAGEIGIPPIEA